MRRMVYTTGALVERFDAKEPTYTAEVLCTLAAVKERVNARMEEPVVQTRIWRGTSDYQDPENVIGDPRDAWDGCCWPATGEEGRTRSMAVLKDRKNAQSANPEKSACVALRPPAL